MSIPDGRTGTINYRIPGLANDKSEELNTDSWNFL